MKHHSLSLAYFAGTALSTVDFPPMPEEESLRKPTCTPGRSLAGQEKHSVHKSLALERMHLVDLPQGQGCWGLCSCPLSLTSSDMSFTGRLQQGLGSFWLPGNCSPFKKPEKGFCSIWIKPKCYIYIYIYLNPCIFKALETPFFGQFYLIVL